MSTALSVRMPDDLAEKLSEIAEETERPKSFPVFSGKFSGLRKFRVGDYRVIYSIIGDTALILRISRRREAYRK